MVGIHESQSRAERHMRNREKIRHSQMEIKEHILLPAIINPTND